MTALAFGVSARVGSLRYDEGIAAARVETAVAPGVTSVRIVLPRELREEAAPGDEATVQLRGEDGGFVQVFRGALVSVTRATAGSTILSTDASGELASCRPGASYDQRTAKGIIQALARDAGVAVGTIDIDLPLVGYIADQRRTAWEHIARIAGWSGGIARTDAEGRLVVTPSPSAPAALALRYGREIASLRVAARRGTVGGRLAFAGSGPAAGAEASDARVQTTATLPEKLEQPGPSLVRVAAQALRTPAAASAATAAARRASTDRLYAECWLVPAIRAGVTIEIADAPQEHAQGPWLVTRAVHEVGPGPRGRTRIEATGLAAVGGGLLDAAIAAVGSLL